MISSHASVKQPFPRVQFVFPEDGDVHPPPVIISPHFFPAGASESTARGSELVGCFLQSGAQFAGISVWLLGWSVPSFHLGSVPLSLFSLRCLCSLRSRGDEGRDLRAGAACVESKPRGRPLIEFHKKLRSDPLPPDRLFCLHGWTPQWSEWALARCPGNRSSHALGQ